MTLQIEANTKPISFEKQQIDFFLSCAKYTWEIEGRKV